MSKYEFNNQFMMQALVEAKKAYSAGEIPVGCVIVDRKEGKILVASHNIMQQSKNSNYHAEMLAINGACKKRDNKNLSSCDIYATLEPCTMCATAISNARIGSLYYGASDSKQGAVENGVRLYTSKTCLHRPDVYSGIHSIESEEIIKSFFAQLRINAL